MHFVRKENLVNSMRLARPFIDRRGQVIFEADSKITPNIISAIMENAMTGVYVLEPSEPFTPVSKEEIEFERFQLMQAIALRSEIQEVVKTHRLHRLDYIAEEIVDNFSGMKKKINFIQDVRNKDDFVYKHSVNTAIIATLILGKMGATMQEKMECVRACLIHDIGKTIVPERLLTDETPDEIVRILDNSQDVGFELIDTLFGEDTDIKSVCVQTHAMLKRLNAGREQEKERILNSTAVMLVAQMFEEMTAMNISGVGVQKSSVAAIRYLMEYPDVFNTRIVNALIDSIEILTPGTTVLLSNGNSALVASENPGKILYPMVLEFKTNKMIDLSNREEYGNLEVIDVVNQFDNRYSMK